MTLGVSCRPCIAAGFADAVASADDAAESAWVLATADGSRCSGTVFDAVASADAVAACCTDAVAAVGATGFRRPSRTN